MHQTVFSGGSLAPAGKYGRSILSASTALLDGSVAIIEKCFRSMDASLTLPGSASVSAGSAGKAEGPTDWTHGAMPELKSRVLLLLKSIAHSPRHGHLPAARFRRR